MKITFTGVPGEDHDEISMYGMTFPKGKAVEVSDPLAVNVLANHPHFKSETKVERRQLVLPQTIPSVESSILVSDGHAVVSEHERNDINADPRMLPGAQVSYEQILKAKEGDDNDFRVGDSSPQKAAVAKPRRVRSSR